MSKIRNIVFLLALMILVLIAGIFWGRQMELFERHEKESSTVMLEKISKVFKVVTVEAQVSELYNYKQFLMWDLGPFRKKAIIRINAKASIGYDFEGVEFDVDEAKNLITIRRIPDAEILSIEHDLEYYDMEEGLFNAFSGDELNSINTRAKTQAENAVLQSEVFKEASSQKDQIISVLRDLFELSGWELQLEDANEFIVG